MKDVMSIVSQGWAWLYERVNTHVNNCPFFLVFCSNPAAYITFREKPIKKPGWSARWEPGRRNPGFFVLSVYLSDDFFCPLLNERLARKRTMAKSPCQGGVDSLLDPMLIKHP